MERWQIDNLLEKYLAGETSLEEEVQLRNYFTKNEPLPSDLEEYRILFGFFKQEQQKTYESDVLLPQPQSYKWLMATASIAAILVAVWVLQPFASNPVGSVGNSKIATQNAQALFMMMGSVPETASKKNLQYVSALKELNITQKKEQIKEDTTLLKK